MQIIPVILSGGSGTRLWPVSRSDYPKQLQKLCGEMSLLQQTALRLPADDTISPPIVICNAQQRFLVAEQLREIGVAPSVIVLEPVARSTAPALAIPALWAKNPQDTVLVAMPADHYISDADSFRSSVLQAAKLAMDGHLMTMGIAPTKPHTGFGYIEQGSPLKNSSNAFSVTQFKEKPDLETAKQYLESGKYLWNSGIFIFRADLYLSELDRLQPQICSCCRKALHLSEEDMDFLRLNKNSFAQSPNLSVDYAVMENANNVGVLPVSFEWSDVGGWHSLWQIGEKSDENNVVSGDVVLSGTKNSYIRGENRLITAIGLDNIVIVDTADALMVADMSKVDEVKDIVSKLKKNDRSESREHVRVWRPWGYYERLDSGARFQVKQLMVKPGGKLSMQMHHHRAEHWVVVSGTAKVTCGDEVKLLGPNETTYIPIGTPHRLENPGIVPLFIVEVQSGDYIGEDDIVRFEDIYSRIEQKQKKRCG